MSRRPPPALPQEYREPALGSLKHNHWGNFVNVVPAAGTLAVLNIAVMAVLTGLSIYALVLAIIAELRRTAPPSGASRHQ